MSIKELLYVNRDDILVNGRIKYIPDDKGEYFPYELTCFDRNIYATADIEKVFSLADGEKEKKKKREATPSDDEESRRKSYNRARNNLFDLLMCTPAFDCFVTLTFDGRLIDRYNYDEIVKRIGVWLDNRVRRKGLKYVLVPEHHKDGAVHFHGLMNTAALTLSRSFNAHNGSALFDDEGRPIFNIADFTLGFTTVIPLSGDNARVATAKYCYKYITKSQGKKVGGRYYLSGGDLGRPRYEYVICDYDSISGKEMEIKQANLKLKKVKL